MRSATMPTAPSGAPAPAFSGVRDRLARALARLDPTSPQVAYVLRSILAAWLALVAAYLLELEMPYSAASTVLLVTHPVQGAVIGKGTWRVLGTLGGMLAAFALTAAFAQMPWLFVLGFAFWLGLCVAGMTLLRHFRASGAVVAGYTVGLATFGALQHPQLAFDHIIGRGSTVMVGVVCLGLVSALFSPRAVRGRLETLLGRLAAATAGLLAARQGGTAADGRPRVDPARRGLIAEIYAVDDLLALGKAESADLARRAAAVRQAMAALFAALVGGAPPLPPHGSGARALRALQPVLEPAWREAEDAAGHGPRGIERAVRALRRARERLLAMPGDTALPPAEAAARSVAAERLVEQIDDYLAALDGIAALHRPRPRGTWPPVRFHRDAAAALRNGLRAMLTLALAGAFWIVTGWSHGDMMLLVVAPYCALLATAADPAAGAVGFVKGTVLAVPIAFLCAFGVLPRIDGLPLLLVVLGLFWLPGVQATTRPKHGLAGLAYLVGFNTLTAATNPMRYDLGLFLNGSVAWVLATFFTLLCFRLWPPRPPAREVERLRLRIRDAALAVLRGGRADRRDWPLRQQHRMAQLAALLKSQPAALDRAIGDALAGLHLGRELLRLQAWLRQAPLASPLRGPVADALRRMARRADAPGRAASHARRAARALFRAEADAAGCAAERQRLAAALVDVAALLREHAGYFSMRPRSDLDAR